MHTYEHAWLRYRDALASAAETIDPSTGLANLQSKRNGFPYLQTKYVCTSHQMNLIRLVSPTGVSRRLRVLAVLPQLTNTCSVGNKPFPRKELETSALTISTWHQWLFGRQLTLQVMSGDTEDSVIPIQRPMVMLPGQVLPDSADQQIAAAFPFGNTVAQ